ncbi:hypothetical protein ACIRP2_23350 [Streptomyces sp. NPDC101194]|uniref:hypothetical protein n=1 Tax=Streptomyces sp. NPDC101194 TaxID=3366127 RepID=UPI0038227ECF
MRAATTRINRRLRRSTTLVKAAVGGALLAALIAAPAYADGTPDLGAARTAMAAVPSDPGGSTWLQTDPLTFNHPLNGADRAYEQISEVPDLKIPFPGVWEISYNVRTAISLPANAASLHTHTALFNNGAVMPESEALTGIYGSNHAIQATAGQTFLHTFAAGDVVTLHASRIGQPGNISILSNSDGRTGIMAHWVSPGF